MKMYENTALHFCFNDNFTVPCAGGAGNGKYDPSYIVVCNTTCYE
jgi:hypothetical protein